MLHAQNLSYIHILYTPKGVYIIFEYKKNFEREAFRFSMDLIINLKNVKKNQNWHPKNPYSKSEFIFYFKFSYSKFARDLQNTQTQTQNSNTQKFESPNPNSKLRVFLGAYVWI
jgi:hypothetical protein